ncbi:hypothetical protein GCM10027347_02470 [Larkinella harenae]
MLLQQTTQNAELASMPITTRFWFCLSLLFLTFGSANLVRAADPIPQLVLRNGNGVLPTPTVAFLTDETGQLTLEEVRQLGHRFRMDPAEKTAKGLNPRAVWCAFRVQNESQREWYLEIDPHYIPEIDVYQQQANGSFAVQRLGVRQVYQNRPLQTSQLIVPLRVPPGTTSLYYLRFWTDTTLRFQVQIATLPVLYEARQQQDLINGLYFGVLLALLLYNGFVFLSLRDRTYLYYVFCLLLIGLNIAYQRGYAFQLLWPETPFWNSIGLLAAIGCIASVLFTNAFLNTRQYVPWLRRLDVLIVVPALVTILLSMLGSHSLAFRVQLFTSTMLTVYVFILGIAVYRKGFRPALYYLLGFGSLVAGVVVFMLNDSTGSGMQVGSFIESVILSYALVNKLNTFRLEKEQLQLQALEQASTFSQQLIQTQEHERKRIASELHDSVGQSLGLVKNKLLLLQHSTGQITPAKLDELTQTVAQTIQEVRTISYGLRPVQLNLLGLTEALKSLINETAEASQIHFYEDIDNIDRLFSQEAEINLYRIVQEGVNNLVKHAGATQAIVQIKQHDNQLTLWIEDDGRGMAPTASQSAGLGLRGIRERLHLLKGSLEIRTAHPHGTILTMTIPLEL